MANSRGRPGLVSKIQDGGQPTGSSMISETMNHHLSYIFGIKLSNSDISYFVERRRVLEIQDGNQINGSSNNFTGFTDTYVVSKTIQGFMTTYETSRWPESWPALPRVENPRWRPTKQK